jgi:tetratricopeptide (TPR) repeat protein
MKADGARGGRLSPLFAAGCGLLLLLLAACAGTRPAPGAPTQAVTAESPTPAPSAETAVARFEYRYRERAELATRQGRLADAAQAWEVLVTLRPLRTDYRTAQAEMRAQIQAQLDERLPKALAAHKRSEWDLAAQLYLAVLALNPDHPAAADGLRAVERERNKRNHVGKLARYTLARRAPGDTEPPKAAGAGAAKPAPSKPTPKATGDRNDVEHAAMLASQGELDDAIALLQAHLSVQRNDAEARRMLGDLLNQKAERAQQASTGEQPISPAAVKPNRPKP